MHVAMLAGLVAMVTSSGAQTAASAETGSGAAGAEVRFRYENAQLQPSEFEMVLHEDGSGHFRSTAGPVVVKDSGGIDAGGLDQDIRVTDPLLASIFSTARARKFFAVPCESKDKVAYRGKKTISYTGSDGQGSCAFNWSKDNQIQKLSDALEAVANTLEYGRRLTVEHQHNRLALDAEMGYLAESVKSAQAMELGNIGPVLQSIADDESVMQRARQRARALMAGEKIR